MITDKIKSLEVAKAKVEKLEQQVAAELNQALAALPGQYGFESVEAFVDALKSAVGGKRKPRAPKQSAPAKKTVGKKRRKRAVITDATRAEVKKLVEAGRPGAAIAQALKISLPSVQNIKKALGLVKAKTNRYGRVRP